MSVIPYFLREGLLWSLVKACLLFAGLLGLALAIGAMLVMFRDPPAAVAPTADTLAAAALALPAQAPSPAAGEMLARPLFWAGRRPVPDAVPEAAPPPAPSSSLLDEVKLLGVFASGDRSGIIFALGNERRRLLEGETFDGWRLQALQGSTALFSSEDASRGDVRLTLEHAHVPAPVEVPETEDDQGDE